ncbi:MAG: hypothetical protein ACJAT4_003188 [Granulosicoccus sp.]|jgi:uncharacterized protein (DUF1501 family)
MKRRNFIKASAIASSSVMIPQFLKGVNAENLASSRQGKNLVVIQFSGGNDGLNTIIPYQDDLYYKNRPSLGIKANEVLKVSDSLGFNPAMESLRSLYDEGLMSIINSVGYPNPDRSHFRSMDIWHTASDSDEYLSTGWLGRYLDSNCSGCQSPHHALEVDDTLSLSLKGIEKSGFAMSNPNQLKRISDNKFLKSIIHHHEHEHEENVDYLYKTLVDTQASANYLYQKSKVHKTKVKYPQGAFGNDLKQIAELMTADADIKIYYANLGGFDTHVGQKNKQARLLKTYSDGMSAFVKDLKSNGLLDDTLIMTFSEFGRRVQQNASGGTDHGTANNVFLMGGNLKKKGFYNSAPDLKKLDKGDLIYQMDFRKIYATILEDWLDASPTKILGKRFEKIII